MLLLLGSLIFTKLDKKFLFWNSLYVSVEPCILPVVCEIFLLENFLSVIDLKALLHWPSWFERSHEKTCNESEDGQDNRKNFKAFLVFMRFSNYPPYDFFIESIGEFGRVLVNKRPSIEKGLMKAIDDFMSISFDLLNNVKVWHQNKWFLNSKSYLFD